MRARLRTIGAEMRTPRPNLEDEGRRSPATWVRCRGNEPGAYSWSDVRCRGRPDTADRWAMESSVRLRGHRHVASSSDTAGSVPTSCRSRAAFPGRWYGNSEPDRLSPDD